MITILNIIRIIYSHYIINKYNSCSFDSNVIEYVVDNHNTSNLNNYGICNWIKYLKKINQCKNWNEYQMFREGLYRKKMYKYKLFTKHTNYADFEKKQNLKTYILRFIGNCIY